VSDLSERDPRPVAFASDEDAASAFACALCGLRFTHGGQVCASCPITHGCEDIVRCPRCGYQFPRGSRTVAWLQRLFRGRRGAASTLPAAEAHPIQTLDHLRPGEVARVLKVSAADTAMLMKLSQLGLVPGAEVRVQQSRPAAVVRVGETTVALQRAVARVVHVRRLGSPIVI
jgi:Fe2+ transport system protein FeoA